MKSQGLFNQLNVSVVLFFLYYLQGVLYPTGSFLSQSVLLLYLLIGFVSLAGVVLYKKNPGVVSILVVFYLLLSLSFLASPPTVVGTKYEAIGLVNTFDQFKGISFCILSFFISYYLSVKRGASENNIVFVFWIFFLLSIIRFFYSIELNSDREFFTNNSGYFLVSVLPFLPFVLRKNRILGFVSVALLSYFVILSSKRGAIVCLVLGLLVLFYFYYKNRQVKSVNIFSFIIIFLIFVFFLYESILSNEYLLSRLESTREHGVGTRTVAYELLWQHWINDTNILTILFGNGMSASVSVWGNYAHNDWLELLVSNGAVGVLLYAAFFIFLVGYIRRMKLDSVYKSSAYICILIWLLKTIFSMGYTDMLHAIVTLLLGFIIGKNEHMLASCNLRLQEACV